MISLGRLCFVGLMSVAGIEVAAAAVHDTQTTAARVQGSELDSYPRLLEALTSGRAVTVVVDFSHCTDAQTKAAGPNMTGGFPIQGFLAPSREYIAFADVHATLDAKGERVTEYIRYHVSAEGTVSIRTARLQADGSQVGNPMEFACRMGSAAHFYLRGH